MKTLWPGTELTNLQRAEKMEKLAVELSSLATTTNPPGWNDDLCAMSLDLFAKAGKIPERTITMAEADKLKHALAKTNIDPRALLKKYHCTRWGTMQIQHYREAMDNLETLIRQAESK